ncbi:MAG: ABC transporter permease [Bacteroides sp.]|jgi:putative ABC transport system permease protein|nr:ABC transporter permease [Bacteroides sp.]
MFPDWAVLAENFKISLLSIRSHMLRTSLTVLIIAFGIMALVGILTAISSIESSISSNFARLGANSFSIRNREMRVVVGGGGGGQAREYRRITFEEATAFKDRFDFPALVSVSTFGTGSTVVRYRSRETNPNVSVVGSDENYLVATGNELEYGRNFSPRELQFGENVVILGADVVKTLFPNNENPLQTFVTFGNTRYQVIGVMKGKGAGMGFSEDQRCVLPLVTVRKNFSRPQMNYTITVSASNVIEMESAIGEATGLFRVIRGVRLGEDDNFDVARSDNIAQALIENMRYVTLAASIIGMITLIGAAIGLMNIMLVSVTERTQEIGIRKALGATRKVIKQQFLSEAIVICQIGGVLGILLGVLIGNILSLVMGNPFIVPWVWVIGGVLLCIGVGLIAGYYPAAKASKLDPIESLRYE